MPCDTRRLPRQTLSERKEEIRKALAKLMSDLTSGRIKPVIGPTGGIAFQGWAEQDRGRVSDACAYRMILATGTATAKMAIQRAEMLSGRSVNRASVAAGHHAHSDGHGGLHWHGHK